MPHTPQPRTGRPWRRLHARVYRTESICHLCGHTIDKTLPAGHPDSFTVDHLEPVSVRPELALARDNVHAAHHRCNTSRGAQPLESGMPSTRPASCHPGRPSKTSDGLCETCYKRRRYQTDPTYREQVKARNRQPPRRPEWRECYCGIRFVTDVHNRVYCSPKCRRREQRRRQAAHSTGRRLRTIVQATRIETGETGPIHTEHDGTGALWAYCPCGDTLSVYGPHYSTLQRHCYRCRYNYAPHRHPEDTHHASTPKAMRRP